MKAVEEEERLARVVLVDDAETVVRKVLLLVRRGVGRVLGGGAVVQLQVLELVEANVDLARALKRSRDDMPLLA
jgi:hypothetical protein